MSELIHQLGIDWKLLLTQGVNFFILLVALTFLIYKPLVKTLEARRKKIESGILGAEEAEKRLHQIEILKKEKVGEAEKKAAGIISEAEKQGHHKITEAVKIAEIKANEVLLEAAQIAENKKQKELSRLEKQAGALIKEVIIKTVELSPEQIDEKLIARASELVKQKI